MPSRTGKCRGIWRLRAPRRKGSELLTFILKQAPKNWATPYRPAFVTRAV